MIYIDKFAYTNSLAKTSPFEKLFFGGLTFSISLMFNSRILFATIILTITFVLLVLARIPLKFFFKLSLLPLYFVLAAIAAILFEHTQGIPENLFIMKIYDYGITRQSLDNAFGLFMKSLSGIFCLYFIALTVPIGYIVRVFEKIKIPNIFIELTLLMYRFVFIMLENVDKIHIAQKARLGNSSYKNSLRSFVKLSGSLFILSHKKYSDIYNGLESRCYSGKFDYLPLNKKISVFNLFIIIVAESFFITIGFLTTGKTS